MKGFCPHCETVRELVPSTASRSYEIKGQNITVDVSISRCSECGEEFDYPGPDPLEKAYAEYRRRKGMIQPDQIKETRASYGLTQKELSSLLGWGGATLSRYENGALQDEAHDTSLRLAMDPRNLLSLIDANPSALSGEKLNDIVPSLKRRILEEEGPMRRLYEERFGSYQPDEYSGYRRLSIDKLFTSILFFCVDPGIVKTKLNKLLFYLDFKHFKEYSVSVTGARYAHLPYGPVPDGYSFFLATMGEDEKSIGVEESFFNGYPAELLVSVSKPDITMFSPSEVKILGLVKEHFEAASAKQLSELSHQERGYRETSNGELISYEYAENLGL
jgi:putative zinc finger/helix-turn-helix YgiT family protein